MWVPLIGLIAWERFHPPPFRIEVGWDKVDYEFRDRAQPEPAPNRRAQANLMSSN
jgi:hypothetical protein